MNQALQMKESIGTALALTVILTLVSISAVRQTATPARIRIENNGMVAGMAHSGPVDFNRDDYFMPVNNFGVFR